MKSSIIARFRLSTLFFITTVVILFSCADENREIDIPDQENPIEESNDTVKIDVFNAALEFLMPDTLRFSEGDTLNIHFSTIPWNLAVMDSVSVEFIDTAGFCYPFVSVWGYHMMKDSTWTVQVLSSDSIESGDMIRMALSMKDTTLFSKPIVLDIIRHYVPVMRSVEILSGLVSAYEKDSVANVILRTMPWDLLLQDSVSIQLTDTLGNSDEKCIVEGGEMLADSTWLLKVTLARLSKATVKVAVTCPDTTILSSPVEIRKITFKMNNIKIGSDYDMKYDAENMTYYVEMPLTDFSDVKLRFNFTGGDSITVGNSSYFNAKYYHFNLNEPIKATLWSYGLHKEYIVKIVFFNTNLPVVTINTPDGKAITSKTVWTDGAFMKIVYPDGTPNYEGTLSMRGRGNNTWSFNKKPYALKLDEKAEILGMPEHKRWILLANYKDRTLLRNDAAFWLSKQTDLPYTIRGQYVELVMNGKHMGNYYLCEQAKINKNRINIDEPDLENPELGGFFAEMESYYEYYSDKKELGFWSKTYNLPYILKDPDIDTISSSHPAYKYFKNFIESMEKVLDNEDSVKQHAYERYIDVDKAIDYALVNELAGNHDFYNTWPKNGPHSCFLYIDRDGRLCFGPVWDFDYHTFMPSRANQWEALSISSKVNQWGGWWGQQNQSKFYYSSLLKDPDFKKRLVERWNLLKEKFAGLPDYIDKMADSIRVSEEWNYKVWGKIQNSNGDENGDINMTFQKSVDTMKEGFNKKWKWIDDNISKL
ncbi:MAG: CotH kinase family protein [Bacteroidaceae bacterium]|nr:CotH kinase family protein [Bacteroidaceae bacterium]